MARFSGERETDAAAVLEQQRYIRHTSHQSKRGRWLRLRLSFGFAGRGLQRTWLEQENFRIEVSIGLAALLLAWWLQVSAVPVLLSIALVLSLELMNTALEAVVDMASPDYHPLAEQAKDVAAAAVLLASLVTVMVGLLHLGPALWRALAMWLER